MDRGSPRVVTGNVRDKHASRHPLERLVVKRFDTHLREWVVNWQPRRVMEIGCGEGDVIPLVKGVLPDCHYTAVDIEPGLLERASKQGADKTILIDAESPPRLPCPAGSFDLVLLIEVLEHVCAPEELLDEAARLSKRVIATVPCEPWWRILNMLRLRYLRQLGNTPGHVNHWGYRGFTRLLAKRFHSPEVRVVFPWLAARMEIQADE